MLKSSALATDVPVELTSRDVERILTVSLGFWATALSMAPLAGEDIPTVRFGIGRADVSDRDARALYDALVEVYRILRDDGTNHMARKILTDPDDALWDVITFMEYAADNGGFTVEVGQPLPPALPTTPSREVA